MKRLAILCIAIAIAIVIAVVASNQSAYARSYQPFKQDAFHEELETADSETQDSETKGSESQRSVTQRSETQVPETQVAKTQVSEIQGSETQVLATQGSETRESNQRGGSSSEPVPFERKFWRYLRHNNYKNWAPVPGQTGDFTAGQSPHGNLIKMYLNRTAAGNTDTMPVGSIIVKENYNEDESLQAITVMYKNAGYNPGSGDWYWVKYNPDGSVPFAPLKRAQ